LSNGYGEIGELMVRKLKAGLIRRKADAYHFEGKEVIKK
jgi:hypothetical protein